MARLTPLEVVQLWRKYSTDIPARFALGSAQHESDLNPDENDYGDQPNQSDSTSYGLYQLNRTEQAQALVIGDLNDADTNTKVFASVCAARLVSINAAAMVKGGWASDSDRWAYLGMSHNMGLGAALKSITKYGGDWQAYKERNPDLAFVTKGYGDDCISGGAYWSSDLDPFDLPTGGPGAGLELLVKWALIGLGTWAAWRWYNDKSISVAALKSTVTG